MAKTTPINIAVCLKQVDYVYAVSGDDPARHFIAAWDRVQLNNPLDEVALQQAVLLREGLGEGEVWVLSLGEHLMEAEARRALALGADRFVWLRDEAWRELDAWGTAAVLAAAAQKAAAGLIVCGARSLDLQRGEVPAYIACQLGMDLVSRVVGLQVADRDGWLRLQQALGRGDRLDVEARMPLALSVEAGLVKPRHPSHLSRLKAGAERILYWDGHDLPIDEQLLRDFFTPGEVTYPRPGPKDIPLLDGDRPADQRIEWLLSTREDRRETALLRGEPAYLAEKLAEYLSQWGFLKRD